MHCSHAFDVCASLEYSNHVVSSTISFPFPMTKLSVLVKITVCIVTTKLSTKLKFKLSKSTLVCQGQESD